MNSQVDLSACDREPIQIPGAVQPHGALLVLDLDTLCVLRAAGACQAYFGLAAAELLGRPIATFVAEAARLVLTERDQEPRYAGVVTAQNGQQLDVVAHNIGGAVILEFEAAPATRMSAAEMARIVEHDSVAFASTRTIDELCHEAANRFRAITKFDRVMVYRFLPDETGSVIAEDKIAALPPFLNHRYPASDIPRQARALYVRNVIRVIPNVDYVPSGLAELPGLPPLDMSNCQLRSVSPIHIQYLKNMAVAASASMSIVRDGTLWGLVACHHRTPQYLSFDQRIICRLLANALSRQVAAIEDSELFRSRARARAAEDALLGVLAREKSVVEALDAHVADLLSLVPAHGVAVRRKDFVVGAGVVPDRGQTLDIGNWLLTREHEPVFVSNQLSSEYAPAAALTKVASGLLALSISDLDLHQIFWFRAEQIEQINWAGNPHKPAELSGEPNAALTPRKSFELWSETVKGRSEAWSLVDTDTAVRFGRAFGELQRTQAMNRLNETLKDALAQRDRLISQKESLLREGDHRIQNSLQIVGGMLNMQLREMTDPSVRTQLEEAAARVQAVAAVHRRLHKSVEPRTVDIDAYVIELIEDLRKSLGEAWTRQLRVHVSPVSGPTDVAMSLGLALTELLLNAAKYAYGGNPGPLEVDLQSRGDSLRLSVRDWGSGMSTTHPGGTGLGTKLILRLLENLDGSIVREAASPGLRVIISMPLRGSAIAANR